MSRDDMQVHNKGSIPKRAEPPSPPSVTWVTALLGRLEIMFVEHPRQCVALKIRNNYY